VPAAPAALSAAGVGGAGPARLAGGAGERIPRPVGTGEPAPRAGDLVRLAAGRAGLRRRERPAGRAGDHLDGPPRRPALPPGRGPRRRRRVVPTVGLQPGWVARGREAGLGRAG